MLFGVSLNDSPKLEVTVEVELAIGEGIELLVDVVLNVSATTTLGVVVIDSLVFEVADAVTVVKEEVVVVPVESGVRIGVVDGVVVPVNTPNRVKSISFDWMNNNPFPSPQFAEKKSEEISFQSQAAF